MPSQSQFTSSSVCREARRKGNFSDGQMVGGGLLEPSHMQTTNIQQPVTFDLCRITKAKREVDITGATIRSYARQGLNLYKKGKCTFFSRSELEMFIRNRSRVSGANSQKPSNGDGFVYLISASGLFKIGVSKDPGGRFDTIKTANPNAEIVTTIYAENPYVLESSLHERFQGKRVGGEWFALSDRDVESVKHIASLTQRRLA